MSLHLYSTVFPEPLSPTAFQELLSRLPPALQQKVSAYQRWQDAYGSLFGKLLLKKALLQAGFSPDLTGLRTTSYGRPYLEGYGEPYPDGGDGSYLDGNDRPYPDGGQGNMGRMDFNISHSGNRVVCMLSTQGRVGIDLEETGDIAMDDFQSQFTAAEWAAITGAAIPLKAFYHYWTAKESLIKADGRGLQIPLDTLETVGQPGILVNGRHALVNDRHVLVNGRQWHIRNLPIFPGYACHIACEHPIGPVTTEEIGPDRF
jgi:4'-phosphopantetheinyl transferase